MSKYAGPGAELWEALDAIITRQREAYEEHERRKAERRRSPEALAVRADAARRGWDARRAREAAEEAERDRNTPPDGPRCGEMDIDHLGRERFCLLDTGHDDDCDDGNGHAWNRDD